MKNILSEELATLIRNLHQKGWSAATGTNYSFKVNDEGYWVSASGIDKLNFTANDFMHVDKNGTPLPPYEGIKPSAENLIHAYIYKNTTANVVLHSHSVYSTILSQHILDQKLKTLPISGYEVQKALEGIHSHDETLNIPCFENNQNMELFTQQLNTNWKQVLEAHCFLIGNHGCYTWGKDLATAKRHLEAIEFLLECTYKKSLLK
jgi:methylthioribulose-1-phosphate dehydratase